MYKKLKSLLKRSKLAFATSVMILGLGVAGLAITSAQSQTVQATTCDKVNIIYCGLSGSSASGYINSLQEYYTSDKSGHSASPTVNKNYTDIKEVFNHFGASTSIINGMNTTNTKVGYLYRDGRVVVDGKTVGTGGTVAARFSVPGATNISGTNVYVRKTTSSFAQDKAKVIVYFKDGKMVFGAMTNCGNPIDAKPVVPETPPVTPPVVVPPVVVPPVVVPPTPEPQTLVCEYLKPTPSTTVKNQFTFDAKANTTNGATVTNYEFVFGDNTKQDVASSALTASTTHTYTAPGVYVAILNVTGSVNGSPLTVTHTNCRTTITIEAPAQALTCVNLVPSTTGVKNEIMFTATANPVNGATISSYVFSFGDTKTETVTSTATTAIINHTYSTPGNYNATVTVLGTANGKPVSSTNGNCAKPIAIEVPPATECKPGIPIGDVRCNPCEYDASLPADSPECKAPEVMPATGAAGIFSLVGATSAVGAMSHRMFLKRRLR